MKMRGGLEKTMDTTYKYERKMKYISMLNIYKYVKKLIRSRSEETNV